MTWSEADSRDVSRAGAGCRAAAERDDRRRRLGRAVRLRAARSRIVDLGAGDGVLAAALLARFPAATLTALDGSESMRAAASARLASFGDRARVAAFDLSALAWWDRMFGAHLVVSSLCLHHLNDAKKQYLYKAAADRIAPAARCSLPTSSIRSTRRRGALAADAGTRCARAGRRAWCAGVGRALRARTLESVPLSGRRRPAGRAAAPPGLAAPRRFHRRSIAVARWPATPYSAGFKPAAA